MPVAPKDRITQSDKELHVGLELPRHTARQIYLWAQKQEWPEGTELDPPSEYHVTLLYTPSGYDEHKEAWWVEHMEETEARIKGFTSFGPTDDGYAYVLVLDAPEVKEHAEMLQHRAEAMGLEVTHFPGGYKPHLTVGYGPTRVTKLKAPEFQFHVGPSSVSPPRIEDKTAGAKEEERWHTNLWTGLPCNCGWGASRGHRTASVHLSGVEARKLLKAPDKAWRTPKGDAFRQHLAQLPEQHDPLLPYLAQRYKKGDVRLQGEPGPDGQLQTGFEWSPARQNWEDPTLGIEDRLRQYTEHPEYQTWRPNGNGTFSRVAYNPEEVEVLDHLSMRSVAAQLHYRYEQTGSLNADEATAYATRILQMLGYPTDQITLQAALQAWQTEYPDDRVLLTPTAPVVQPTSPGQTDPSMLESGNAIDTGIYNGQQNPGGSGFRGGVRGAGTQPHRGEELYYLASGWGTGVGFHRQADQDHGWGQADAVGLLAGLRGGTRTAQAGQVSPELQSIIDAFGKQYGLTLMAEETPHGVSFDTIEIPPSARGTGVGSRVMQQLKSYADRNGKPLQVQHVVNRPFFDRFNWLNETGGDEYSYTPQSAPGHSTVPTAVNDPLDHWPEWGEQPPDQHRDIQFGNDWAWHEGHRN